MMISCDIEGVVIKELEKYYDKRGWLLEIFRQDRMRSEHYPVMGYISMTKPGVVRGPHEHGDQTDCFGFIGPSTFRLYLWDNRDGSSLYRKKITFEAGENNPLFVIIPPGVVHAYKNIGDEEGIVFNSPNRLYKGENKNDAVDEIRHENITDSPFVVED